MSTPEEHSELENNCCRDRFMTKSQPRAHRSSPHGGFFRCLKTAALWGILLSAHRHPAERIHCRRSELPVLVSAHRAREKT